jgi:hypothetical protein
MMEKLRVESIILIDRIWPSRSSLLHLISLPLKKHILYFNWFT